MNHNIFWFAVMIAALVFSLLLWRLDHICGELDAEKTAHAITVQERDRWQSAAEAYRKEAEAQAENARLCLNREAKTAQDALERAAIVKQAKPQIRPTEEKEKVVDDETRRRAVLRLNRPL